MANGDLLAQQLKWLQHPAFAAAGASPQPPPPGGGGAPGGPAADSKTPLSLHTRFSISSTVGRGGKNNPPDVQAVQAALNRVAHAGLTESGKLDSKTIEAITEFQKTLGGFKPDGLVEPGRRTAKALAAPSKSPPSTPPPDAPLQKPPLKLDLPPDYQPNTPAPPKQGDDTPAAKKAAEEASAAAAKGRQGLAESIAKKLQSNGDLVPDFQQLAGMDMESILDVIEHLDKADALDGFGTFTWGVKSGSPVWKRVAIAILTIRTNWEGEWLEIYETLSEEDQKAVLNRVPADIRDDVVKKPKKQKGATKDPEDDDDDDDGDTVETSGVATSGTDEPDLQAKVTFHSKAKGNLGETEFTVHVSPTGKLTQLETDLTAFKTSLKKLKLDSSIVNLEFTLSLNATADNKAHKLDPATTRVIFDTVQVQAKGELEEHFKSKKLPWLKKIAFKQTATFGTGGPAYSITIEIPIPWDKPKN